MRMWTMNRPVEVAERLFERDRARIGTVVCGFGVFHRAITVAGSCFVMTQRMNEDKSPRRAALAQPPSVQLQVLSQTPGNTSDAAQRLDTRVKAPLGVR